VVHNTCITWCARTESSTTNGHWTKTKMAYNQEREDDEIMLMFAALGTYI
jgi:hypothetical protein